MKNSKLKLSGNHKTIDIAKPVEKVTIDCTPTWEGMLRYYFAVLEDGNNEGKKVAREEFKRMAQAADSFNEVFKPNEQKEVLTEQTLAKIKSEGWQEINNIPELIKELVTLKEKGQRIFIKGTLANLYNSGSSVIHSTEKQF